eukprot:9095911-Prorocentrum_lima.AAC.1
MHPPTAVEESGASAAPVEATDGYSRHSQQAEGQGIPPQSQKKQAEARIQLEEGDEQELTHYGPDNLTLSLAGLWLRGTWYSHDKSFRQGLAGWTSATQPELHVIKEAQVLAMSATWQQGPPNLCVCSMVGDRGQELF